MQIQVHGARVEHHAAIGRIFSADLSSGRHSISVWRNGWEVRVTMTSSASHRVWRGAGKGFLTYAEAIANYKTGAVRAMLEEAQRLDETNCQPQLVAA